MLGAVLTALTAFWAQAGPPGVPGVAQAADPEWTAAGSFFIPGLGQAFQEEYTAAGIQFGAYLVMANQYLLLIENDDYIEPEDRVDGKRNVIRTNRTTFTADLYGTGLLNLQFYSAFSAYRDGRDSLDNAGYSTPAPQETVEELALSPFRWKYLSRPTTFLPLLLPLYLALTPPSDEQFLLEPDDSISREEIAAWTFAQQGMVAVGEESFFRGVLNNGFSDSLGPGWGLAASSTAFGAVHIGRAGQATPAVAGLFGAYVGWMQQRNGYRIGEGVALHYWWNVLISLSMLHKRESDRQLTLFAYYMRF
ncbi:MAG: CPBP family intramembrane metalloprotease [SAR324 cluster bacterium]|nr:CPBP family intramembrane metalloprotease [SAR324 cluster bacterium]